MKKKDHIRNRESGAAGLREAEGGAWREFPGEPDEVFYAHAGFLREIPDGAPAPVETGRPEGS